MWNEFYCVNKFDVLVENDVINAISQDGRSSFVEGDYNLSYSIIAHSGYNYGCLEVVRGVIWTSENSTYQDVAIMFEEVSSFIDSSGQFYIQDCNGVVINDLDTGPNTALKISDLVNYYQELNGNIIVGLNLSGGIHGYLCSLTLDENIKYIADNCFENYTTLSYIYIPNSVEYVGANAFYSCEDLIVNFQGGYDYQTAYENRISVPTDSSSGDDNATAEMPSEGFSQWGRFFGNSSFITEGVLTLQVQENIYTKINNGYFDEMEMNRYLISQSAFPDKTEINFLTY